MKRKDRKDPKEVLILTYRFRIKGPSAVRRLNSLARMVNLTWNYCNETSFHAIRNHSKWLTSDKLDALLAGGSEVTGLHSQTLQGISQEYVKKRVQFKKRKLRWRVSSGPRKSLGWIPFKAVGIKVEGSQVRYYGQWFKFWNSWDGSKRNQRNWKDEAIKILCGSFSEDAKGDWYFNLTCQAKEQTFKHLHTDVGADPGLKDSLVFSDGSRIQNQKIYREFEEKLATAQRARKKRQVRNLHRYIFNKRKDELHKQTLRIARTYQVIYVGDVSGQFLQKTNGKSSTDASIGKLRQLLKYKAMRHSGKCIEVSEISSTVTCSICFKKTGPSGLSDLGVREWICSECGGRHDRDVNSAMNILRFGRESLKQPLAA